MDREKKETFLSEGEDVQNGGKETGISIPKSLSSSGIIEEITQVKHGGRRPNLSLEIPMMSLQNSREEIVQIKKLLTPTPTAKKVNFLVTPSPSDPRVNGSPGHLPRGKSSIRNLLPKLNFMSHNSNLDMEKATDIDLGCSPATVPQDKVSISISRSWSLSKMFTPRIKRTSSLPIDPLAHLNPESALGGSVSTTLQQAAASSPTSLHSKGTQLRIHRSLSLPVVNKDGNARKVESFFRVIPSTPCLKDLESIVSAAPTPKRDSEESEDGGEDIPEEEAVCRICLIELCEGGETLKMECSCKGELALAHQECAIKWFSIKGNKTCDVCKQEVRNLPVTLLRIQSIRNANAAAARFNQIDVNGRVWQEVPILVIVSMLAYFCFLEQLLVGKMGTGAIAISLPFSCVLGLLGSMTSSTMVKRRFVWVYASVQFAFVVLFAHIFYSLVHVQAVLSILLSTFAGFGVAMSGSSILVEYFRWRRRRRVLLHRQENPQVALPPGRWPQPNQTATTTTTTASHVGPQHHQTDIENPETFSGS
nr:E3 ubiquitin-protein ligase MARCH7-like [Ipomoea batatas]